jgi:hypothetical protein
MAAAGERGGGAPALPLLGERHAEIRGWVAKRTVTVTPGRSDAASSGIETEGGGETALNETGA